jgi:hypothetical protein
MSAVATNRQKVAEIARGIIDGRFGILAGARQIRGYTGGHLGLDEFDPDLLTFIAIDSETDDLPLGDVRQYWAPDALEKKDAEIARFEARFRAKALTAAANLVARFTRDT